MSTNTRLRTENASDAKHAPDTLQVRPVVRPRQQVEMQLRSAIVDGVLSQGDRLPSEVVLAEQFGVSRPTVREALRALAESGLISKTPGSGGGSFVTYFDHRRLSVVVSERLINTLELGSITYDEVAAFRDILEVPTARLAAVNHTEEHLQQLREVIDNEKRAAVTDPDVMDYNSEFHRLIAEASGNRLIAAFVMTLHRVMHPLSFIETSPEVGVIAVRHHIDIVGALAHRDPDLAAKHMEVHLSFLRDHAVSRSSVK